MLFAAIAVVILVAEGDLEDTSTKAIAAALTEAARGEITAVFVAGTAGAGAEAAAAIAESRNADAVAEVAWRDPARNSAGVRSSWRFRAGRSSPSMTAT